jgi:serine protease Do
MRDPESAWGRSGLQSGDTVVAVNGASVKDFRSFGRAIGTAAIGDTVTISVLRNGTPTGIRVPVGGYMVTKVKVN